MKKIGLFGCGFLNNIVADCYLENELEGYEIVGCFSKTEESREKMAQKLGIKACNSYDELLALKPDYIVEATNPSALKEVLIKTLENKTNLVILSIGALSDKEFYKECEVKAFENNVKIHIASGAIAGFESLRTARLMNITSAKLLNTKGPKALRGKSIYKDQMEEKEMIAFSGSAYEAIKNLPTGINVGVATALATLGVDETQIEIVSKPDFVGDSQRILVECGDEIKIDLDVYSKTSKIAGYSVVALLQNLNSSIVF